MARQRFPVLQAGPLMRDTIGLTNGSRRPSAVIVFFSFGVSEVAVSFSADPLSAFFAESFSCFAGGVNGVVVLARFFAAADVVFCAPCLGCGAIGAMAILVGGCFLAAWAD